MISHAQALCNTVGKPLERDAFSTKDMYKMLGKVSCISEEKYDMIEKHLLAR